MTAEIAILNQHAVALAADSAVTIGGNTAPKIYPSANKLFTLSKYAPVGVMVYSNAAFMGVPWEIIIKTYRARLGRQTFPTLQGYADDLLRFIETSDLLVPEDQERRHIHERIHRFFSMIHEHVKRTAENGDRSLSEVLEDTASTLLQEWGSKPVFTGHDGIPLDSDSISLVGEWSDEVFNQIREGWFPEIEATSPVARNLVTLGQMSVVRLTDMLIFAGTGLVVAGYGETELFPSVITNRLDFRLNGHLKHERQDNKSNTIDFERRAAIIPFAQSDMVATFIEGADPEYQRVVDTQVQNALDALFQSLADDILGVPDGHAARETLMSLSTNTWKRIKHEMDNARREKFVNPLLEILISLPKTELANMAESMVSLTSLKRRLSDSAETVGGPVDVALISKGDGFIWIDRKHYFDPAVNRHFFSNYFREVRDDLEPPAST